MKIATLASTFGVSLVHHVWGSGVGLAVATLPLTLYTCNPVHFENEPVIEFYRNTNAQILVRHQFTLGDDGVLAVPMDKPGLGVEVDEDISCP